MKYLMLVIYSKKTNNNTIIREIENKITTDHDHNKITTIQEFNKLASKNFTVKLAYVNLANKSDIANFVKHILVIN